MLLLYLYISTSSLTLFNLILTVMYKYTVYNVYSKIDDFRVYPSTIKLDINSGVYYKGVWYLVIEEKI